MINQGYANVVLAVGRNTPGGVNLLGTAFHVGGKKFATAGHLTGQNDSNLCLIMPKIGNVNDYQDTSDTSVNMAAARIAEFDPVHDIAILEAPDVTATSDIELSSSDASPPGSAIVSVGFPHCGDGRLVLTQQSSTVGARVLLSTGPTKSKHLVLNVLARPGQSGSPVFLDNTPWVCAMLLGSYIPPRTGSVMIGNIDPASLHQTTHAVSAEYIRAML